MSRKRKSHAKRAPRRRQERLPTKFKCPFCNHNDIVAVRMDRKNHIGEATCEMCAATFSTSIDTLSDPIDVYSEWIDECERVEEAPKQKRARAT